MKSPLCASALIALSLLSSDLFAAGARSPLPATSNPSANISADSTPAISAQFEIPGPLRSFLRMAGISQKIAPEEVLPLLSRNVFTQGYEGTSRPTEFLILLRRYVVQARELSELAAGSGMVIRVTNCTDARPLLRILGYRSRANCGEPGTSLQTEDAERAFLAIDSGFPLPDLEQTLQGGKPFEYAYSSSTVPVLFAEGEWTKASRKNSKENSLDLLDTLLNDPAVSRLYWALSQLDSETGRTLQQSVGLPGLVPYAAVLDFYGRALCIRDGRVLVPGGVDAEAAWKDVVGASPAYPAAFVTKLLSKDKGWLVAYFDVLSRVGGTRQAYFTDSRRLRFFYAGLHSLDTSVPATRGIYRPAPGLLLLVTRLHFESNGDPLVPGNLDVWKDILLAGHPSAKVRRWEARAAHLSDPDHLLQMLFALSRTPGDNGPL